MGCPKKLGLPHPCKVGQGLEQSSPVEVVPTHGRGLKQNGLQGPLQHKPCCDSMALHFQPLGPWHQHKEPHSAEPRADLALGVIPSSPQAGFCLDQERLWHSTG